MIVAGLLSRRGAVRLAAILLACALSCAALAARASALAPSNFYGANIQPIFEKGFVPQSSWGGLIAAMSAGGLKVARVDAAWAWAEPKAPVKGVHSYDWSPPNDPMHSLDGIATLLASNGIRMLPVLAAPPSWAGGSGQEMTSAHYGDFVAFSQAYAARYGAGGSFWSQNPQLPDLPAQQFEVWTEANSTNLWTGSPDPNAYAQVLEPLSTAVHSVDPSAQILASIGWQNPAPFISQLFALGAGPSINAIGFHPYSPDVPGIIGLVQQVHSALAAAGDPNLPIDDTETGEPTPPGGPSDASRASLLSLAGDALAHADCNSQDFDVYAITGSGTSAEPINEGYMGILDDMSFQPNLTGQALFAASQRWQASPAGGLVLCGSGATPASALLPLQLSLTHTSPTCVDATISYYGNPVQSAQVVLRTVDGRVAPATTNTAGQTQMCLQNGPPITDFTAYAEVSSPITTASFVSPDIAQSPTYTCPVSITAPTAPCTVTPTVGSSPSQPTTTTSSGTTTRVASGGTSANTAVASASGSAKGCTLTLALLRIRNKRTSLRGLLKCHVAKQPSARMQLTLTRRHKKRGTTVARVTLGKGHWTTFTIRAVPRTGDRLTASVAANKKLHLPKLTATLTATAKIIRAASHPAPPPKKKG